MSLALRADLAEDFDESDLAITVDVVELETASESFRHRIERDWLALPLDKPVELSKELTPA